MLESLNSIDPAVLLEVTRQDLDLPAFELIDGSVTPLSYEKMIETTGGLYCFGRNVSDGSQVFDGQGQSQEHGGCPAPACAGLGKARNLGQRSLAYIEPGALSASLILEFMRWYVESLPE